jgi:hypothetical protein
VFLLLALAAGMFLFVAKYIFAAFEADRPVMVDCTRLLFMTYNTPLFACDTLESQMVVP